LMQIREKAAREWADAERLSGFEHAQCVDPFTNTLAGTWYLRKLLQRYNRADDPIPFALADYNAGRGNVLKWTTNSAATNSAAFMDQIGFPGTKAYILAIRKRYQHYRSRFDQLHKWTDSGGQMHYSEQPPVESPNQPPPPLTGENAAARLLIKDLQGSWVVTNATLNGKATADRSLWEGQWTFEGNELVLRSPEKGTARFNLKFDTKAEPKAFHLTAIEPANSGSGWMLFARGGTTLKIAFYDNLEGRPEAFESR